MWCYRNAKLALDAIHNLASRGAPQNQNFQHGSRICQSGYFSLCSKSANFNGFSSFSSMSRRLVTQGSGVNRSLYNSFLHGGRRFYYVDPNNVHHFKRRGPREWWYQNPRQVLFIVAGVSGILITAYFWNLETVPYTNRTHFILLSKAMERRLGEIQFENMKENFKGKILPSIHPDSVRVSIIAKDIIDALQRGLRKEEHVWSDVGYASEHVILAEEHNDWRDTLSALAGDDDDYGDGDGDGKLEGNWHKENEILDDKWVQQSREKGRAGGSQPATSHLDGLNWEVLVVNEPSVNALCLPGGKIVVFTGLLELVRSDAEIATVIGHEVAHAVARHSAERLTNHLWYFTLQLILYQFIMPDIVSTMSNLFLSLPFSRRMEMEADYIGLLLIASAGYDPRVAPRFYEKLGKVNGESALREYLSTHPSGKKRAESLAQARIMEEAVTIYKDVRSGRDVEGFL